MRKELQELAESARRREMLAWLLEIDEDARAALYDSPGWTDEDVMRELAELEELLEAEELGREMAEVAG